MIVSHISFSPKKALLRIIMFFFVIVVLFWIFLKNSREYAEVEYIFLLDNSLSMSVQDIENQENSAYISRLDASKIFIKNFLETFSPRSGLVTFSDYILMISPISPDYNHIIDALTGVIPVRFGGGSDVFGAVSSVSEMYKTHKNLHIIVFTDAEFFEKKIENFLPKNNIKISFIGVGTERWGLMLMEYDTEWRPLYRQFEGKNAVSVFSEKSLEDLARYFSAESFSLADTNHFHEIFPKIFQKNTQNISKNLVFFIFIPLLFAIIIFPIYSYHIRTHDG